MVNGSIPFSFTNLILNSKKSINMVNDQSRPQDETSQKKRQLQLHLTDEQVLKNAEILKKITDLADQFELPKDGGDSVGLLVLGVTEPEGKNNDDSKGVVQGVLALKATPASLREIVALGLKNEDFATAVRRSQKSFDTDELGEALMSLFARRTEL